MKNIINAHANSDQNLIAKFREMEGVLSLSCVVADAQDRDNVMRSYMKPRTVHKKIIGPAFTVKLTAGDLIDYLDVFRQIKAGDVLLVDAFGETETSVLGGLMCGLCRAAGVVGAVVDGSVRDTDEARMLEFPVYSKAVGPRSTHSPGSQRMEPYEFNTPIVCAGVAVNPGDLIVADEIGITVVPQRDLARVYEKAKQQAAVEEAARKEILKGKTIEELLAQFGRL
jgi:3-hexulose-6-phosphate synthase/6-phospho-3-hexuloisomerase